MSSSSTSPDPSVDGLSAEKLLAGALHGTPVSSPAFNWEPPPPAEVAPWFPDYEILSLAGRGAMGAVYRGVQRKFDRPVAIKLLPPGLAAHEGVVSRFEREARTMAQLNHPNIVTLYDYGRTPEGHLFIVMEYVDGADLSRLIHSTGISVPQALEIITQVCDALQYAHSRGFVHRDVKPGNVLVNREGGVKIADFGLAKLLGDTPNPNATLTGTILGTPDYTAPEQLKGESVDHRADIYSLGVMFYEMLTGELPRGAWEPPSRHTPQASAGLDEIVTRALQSAPDKRYQHASEVKAAVEAAGRKEAQQGPLPPAAKRAEVLAFVLPAAVGAAGATLFSSGSPFAMAGIILTGLSISLFFESCLRWRSVAVAALAGTLVGMILPPGTIKISFSTSSLKLAKYCVLLVAPFFFKRTRRGYTVAVMALVCGFGAFLGKQKIDASLRLEMAEVPPQRIPEPSARALEEIDKVIHELADAQESFDRYTKQRVTRYWTEEEQNRQGYWMKQLTEKIRPRIALLPGDHPKRIEAEKRIASLNAADNAMKLPALPRENCVHASFRESGGNAEYFEGQELVPGLRAWPWIGRNDSDRWVYYVEASRAEVSPELQASGKDGSLEHYPEFWPLDLPVEPLRLPLSGPQSNTELEWIIKQFPRETATDSTGLVVAEFEAAGDPQLRWKHWSRSVEDVIPWAAGNPHVSGGAHKGHIIVRAGKCYTVFDGTARPRLCGANASRAIVWAARRIMQADISVAASEWLKGKSAAGPELPKNIQQITGRYSEFTAPDCAVYWKEIAESHRPWRAWESARDRFEALLRQGAGQDAGNGIPFQRIGGKRLLVTPLVCSRGVAEKLAEAFKADFPWPEDQKELDALAALLPVNGVAHCGNFPQTVSAMKRLAGLEAVPDGKPLTIQAVRDAGTLWTGLSRALLLLAWPEEEPSGKGRKVVPP